MSEASPDPGPTSLGALDEAEHQALDLLDELRCGADWIAILRGSDRAPDDGESSPRPDASARLDAALAELGEDRETLAEAEGLAATGLARIVAVVAQALVEAARPLARTDARGPLDPDALDELAARLDDDPSLAPALAPAVESAGVFLGLSRDSIAWAVLISLGEGADATASAELQRSSAALADRLAAAWPATATPTPIPTPLRVFRSATVALAGPDLRARALAAEHPDRLDLARPLVTQHRDPATLIERFDQARAALDAASSDDDPAASIDGPKRRFTALHLILAAIVLGLSLWHYLWR